jgi:hypothetical protein
VAAGVSCARAYMTGKETVFLEAARRCQMPICVTAAEKATHDLLDWLGCDLPLEAVFTCDPSKTLLHAVQWNYMHRDCAEFGMILLETLTCHRLHDDEAKIIIIDPVHIPLHACHGVS